MRGGLWGVEVQKISREEKGQCHSGRPTWTRTKSPRSGRTSSRASDHEQHRSHSIVRSTRRRNWRQVITGALGRPFQKKSTHLSSTELKHSKVMVEIILILWCLGISTGAGIPCDGLLAHTGVLWYCFSVSVHSSISMSPFVNQQNLQSCHAFIPLSRQFQLWEVCTFVSAWLCCCLGVSGARRTYRILANLMRIHRGACWLLTY